MSCSNREKWVTSINSFIEQFLLVYPTVFLVKERGLIKNALVQLYVLWTHVKWQTIIGLKNGRHVLLYSPLQWKIHKSFCHFLLPEYSRGCKVFCSPLPDFSYSVCSHVRNLADSLIINITNIPSINPEMSKYHMHMQYNIVTDIYGFRAFVCQSCGMRLGIPPFSSGGSENVSVWIKTIEYGF